MLNLMKIFEGYVRNYHILNLTNTDGNNSFTLAEIDYFRKLGSMLGYWCFTEDTADGEVRPMDLSWWDGLMRDSNGDEVWGELVLHLERENYYRKDVETLEKIFAGDRKAIPQNVIGLIRCAKKERMDELISLALRMCNVKSTLLVFRIDQSREVRAYYLHDKKIADQKIAHIAELGGTYYMYFESEVK